MKSVIRPHAKMNRYWAFSPLYSTVLPMPLLIEYSIDVADLEEERAKDCGGYHKEYTGTEP